MMMRIISYFSDSRGRCYFASFLIALASFAVYLPALGNDFVNWDDDLYVYENRHIRSLDRQFLRWAITSFHAANWHPLTWVSHALDYAAWGLDPRGHHLTNILLHAANTFLAALLAYALLEAWRARAAAVGSPLPDDRSALIAAGATGILFGLHPLHVESVAWVSERKDLLCGFFFLMSVLVYARSGAPAAEGWSRYLRKAYLPSLVLFALALMSKPMAVSLPFVLLLLDWHPFGRVRSRRDLLRAFVEKLPFFALSALAGIATVLAQHSGGTLTPFRDIPPADRLLVAVQSCTAYLGKLAWPAGLLPIYVYPETISLFTYAFLPSLVLVVGLTVLSVRYAGRARLPAAVWWYFLITLAPAIGIVQVGVQSMADRYTYLPGIGPSLGFGVTAAWLWRRSGTGGAAAPVLRTLLAAFAVCVAVVLSLLTVKQISVWRDSSTLWSYVIEREPSRFPAAYYNRGLAFVERGENGSAIADYDAAIKLDPDFPEAYNSRGALHLQTGNFERAVEDFSRAIFLNPQFVSAYNNRGIVLMKSGRKKEALDDFGRALRLDPSFAKAYNNRGKAFAEEGRIDRAISDQSAAIEIDPRFFEAYVDRGVLLAQTGQIDRAIEDFSTSVVIEPSRFEGYYNRGLAYERSGRIDLALSDLNAVLRMMPGLADAYAVRGSLYQKTDNREFAVRDFRKACSLGHGQGCSRLRALERARWDE